MGRTRGRFFTTRFERDRQQQSIGELQGKVGTTVQWWLLTGAVLDSVFDEPDVMGGRTFTQLSRPVPVLSAVPLEGANTPTDAGRYVTNRVMLRVSLRQAEAAGVPDLSVDYEARYGDRFVLRGLVYDITAIASEGNFDATNEDVVLRIEGRQLRPDELSTDPDFASYAGTPVQDWTTGDVTVAGGAVQRTVPESPWHASGSTAWYDPNAPKADPDVPLRLDEDGKPYLEVD